MSRAAPPSASAASGRSGVRWLTPRLARYVLREVLAHFVGLTLIVLAIFLVRRFGALLADAAEGSLSANVIAELLALRTAMALPSLIPVTAYLAIVLGLGRLHQDQETTALAACGVPPHRISAIVIVGSVAAAGVVAVASFGVRPWAAERFLAVKSAALARTHVSALAPGRFYEIGGRGTRVMFAEARDPDGAMRRVFVQDRRGDRLAVLAAERALAQYDPVSGARFLTLVDGFRYDLRPDESAYEITRYREYGIRVDTGETPAVQRREQAAPTAALRAAREPAAVAEWQWRLAMPVSTVLLALVALPLSRTDPRRGKYASLLVALVVYLAYRQLLGAGRDWLERGSLPPFPGLWVIHAACLAAAAVLAGRRWLGDRFGRWWRT
jgi:lipopolysaccharide export system permease protein